MSFHGNQIGDMVPILPVKNVLLTFQMEQNGTFRDNSKYEYWILHKKKFEMKFSIFFIKLLISPLTLALGCLIPILWGTLSPRLVTNWLCHGKPQHDHSKLLDIP